MYKRGVWDWDWFTQELDKKNKKEIYFASVSWCTSVLIVSWRRLWWRWTKKFPTATLLTDAPVTSLPMRKCSVDFHGRMISSGKRQIDGLFWIWWAEYVGPDCVSLKHRRETWRHLVVFGRNLKSAVAFSYVTKSDKQSINPGKRASPHTTQSGLDIDYQPQIQRNDSCSVCGFLHIGKGPRRLDESSNQPQVQNILSSLQRCATQVRKRVSMGRERPWQP